MEKIVSFVGAFLKHVVGILILCWRRMLRAGLIAFAIGVVLALLVAVISTGQAFPGALALVVALLFGAALAYGVAMTVFVEEFFLGVVDLIRLLEGDARAVAHITATMAEREVGDVGHGLRRLFGLPAPSQPTTLAPTLPALPRYPAAPTSAVASPSTSPSTAPRAESLARDAAVAGAPIVAGAAIATRMSEPAPQASQDAQATALGQPVRADQLPRIGWTLEHEAVRPVRIASLPDTLAELAGSAALLGAQHLFGRHEAPAAAPEPQPQAQLEPAARPADAEPLDAMVVSAQPLPAPSPAPSPAPDSTPLEDERLAEPVALTLPEDEQTPVASADAPAQAPRFDPIMLAPAPATTPLRPEEHPAAEPRLDPLDPAMLTPAAPTTPLAPEDREDRQDAPPLDPAMLTPAAPTTPLAQEPPALDPAMLTPAPPTTPLAPEERRAAWLDEPPPLDPAMLTPAPATTPIAPEPAPVAAEPPRAEQPTSAPDQPQAPTVAEQPASPIEESPARTAFARITRPVAELGATLDAISRASAHSAHSAPRASAPESGLWERLSQALIDRSGAPSSPFAAPQSRPPAPSPAPGEDEGSQQG